jgi:hypothetical protein
MQITNNYVPTIVERGARRATRYVGGGENTMRYLKKYNNRAYRRMMKQHLYKISIGLINSEEYNDEPRHCRCTAWDIW